MKRDDALNFCKRRGTEIVAEIVDIRKKSATRFPKEIFKEIVIEAKDGVLRYEIK